MKLKGKQILDHTITEQQLDLSTLSINTQNSGATLNVSGDTIIYGNITGLTFSKSGGTSQQFLMADGSISTTGTTLPIYDNRYVKQDQTIPQTISNGIVSFNDGIKLGTTPTVGLFESGKIFYDVDNKTISAMIDEDITMQIGQEELILIYNNNNYNILNGQLLYFTGSFNDYPTVSLANSGINEKSLTVGMATQTILSGTTGFITARGLVHNLNLSGYTDGDILYLSDIIDGDYSNIPSTSYTSRINRIGFVVSTGITGSVYILIRNEDISLSLTDKERNILLGNVASTGVYDFTGLSINSPTTINISSLNGWIISNTYFNATYPISTHVSYSGQTGVTLNGLLTSDSTYILITSGTTIIQQSTFPTPQQRRENILLGKVNHPNRTTILSVNQIVDYSVSPMSALRDMFSSIKLINDGITVSPNGTNLNINMSSGYLYGMGINWHLNELNPNQVLISGSTATQFFYRTQLGGNTGLVNIINPNVYDNGGVITNIPTAGDGQSRRTTNQRIYLYPTGTLNIQYGQQVYDSLPLAIAGQQTENFIKSPNVSTTGILIGLLSVRRTTTDLSDTNYAIFTPSSIFGESVGGVNGISTTTLQQAYDNSIEPEIVTSSILDGLTIKRGSNSDSDNLINFQNGIGSIVANINALGDITGHTFVKSGGTSTQFLKADGTIDSNTYATSSSLSTEISNRVSGDASLSTIRLSGDNSLSTVISSETSTRLSGDTSLSTGLSSEIVNRSSAVSTEASSRISGDASLSTGLSTEASTRLSVDTSLSTGLSSEIVNRTNAVSTEASSRISGDASLSTGLSSEIVNRSSAVSTESSSRVSGDSSLTTGLSTESSTRLSVDTSLSTGLSSEISSRISGDGSLSTVISTEISNRISGDTSLSTIRLSGDNSLTTVISSEISSRISGDGSLSTVISSETSSRVSGDGSLSTVISTEISNRISGDGSLSTIRLSGDNSLSTVISSEISTRVSGDASLSTGLSTEASTRLSVDTSLSTGLSTEYSTRLNVDTSLSTGLSSETSSRVSGDASLSTGLSSEIVNRTNAVSTEASTRVSGDGSLSTIISTEISSRVSGDSSLSTIRLSGDNSLSTVISTEISNRVSGDGSLSTIRLSGDNSLSTGLSSETSSRVSGDASLSVGLSTHNHSKLVDSGGTTIIYIDNSGSVHIDGDIIQSGSTWETHANLIYTSGDTIILRDGATSGLGIGEYVGLVAIKYDGVNDGQLVFDKDGWARIGDVGSLQKLATIEETSLNGYVMIYNTGTTRLEGINPNTFALSSGLSTESSSRVSGDASLSTIRLSGDNSLSTALSSEIVNRSSAVSTEASTRLSVDTSLSTGLSSEIVNRSSAVSSETSSRISGDVSVTTLLNSNISSSISTEVVNRNSAISSSISTEASSRVSGDGSLSTVISTEISNRVSGDASLSTIRLSGDNSLSTVISSETSSRVSGDASLSTGLSSEIVNRSSAVSTEASTRLSVDTSLSTGLSSEIVNRTNAVSTEASSRISGDSSVITSLNSIISSSISTEVSSRVSGDGSLSTIRLSGDNSLSTVISTESSIRLSVDTSLSTVISSVNSGAVHITGTETITGTKTFNPGLVIGDGTNGYTIVYNTTSKMLEYIFF